MMFELLLDKMDRFLNVTRRWTWSETPPNHSILLSDTA
jgi:hypothetical protein